MLYGPRSVSQLSYLPKFRISLVKSQDTSLHLSSPHQGQHDIEVEEQRIVIKIIGGQKGQISLDNGVTFPGTHSGSSCLYEMAVIILIATIVFMHIESYQIRFLPYIVLNDSFNKNYNRHFIQATIARKGYPVI